MPRVPTSRLVAALGSWPLQPPLGGSWTWGTRARGTHGLLPRRGNTRKHGWYVLNPTPDAWTSTSRRSAAEVPARTLAFPEAQSVEDLTALLTSAEERRVRGSCRSRTA